jgi:hypothetical protein
LPAIKKLKPKISKTAAIIRHIEKLLKDLLQKALLRL